MKRRDFIQISASYSLSNLLFSPSIFRSISPRKKRPNILFITIDDLRPELGCYGVEEIITPNIDHLAEQGLLFSRSYCQQALCNPSRASLLTGLRPDSIRVWDQVTDFRRINPYLKTLPQYFKNNGYRSHGIGKIFHNRKSDPESWSQRQSEIKNINYYQDPETQKRLAKNSSFASFYLGKSQEWISQYLRGPATEAFDAPDNLYLDGVITEMAVDWMERNKDSDPFFLAVGYYKPHLPFVAPKKYWDLYDRVSLPLAKNDFFPQGAPLFAMNTMFELATYEDFNHIRPSAEAGLNESQARLLKHGYYACVSFIDAQVGILLAELERFNLRDNTIIVLWGDHGWKLGEHRSWGKQTNYEIDTRSPLIISVPDMSTKGKATSALVEFVDVYPTLCELAGLKIPDYLEGTSMLPLLEKPDRNWKTGVFSQFPRGYMGRYHGRSIRTDRYRYVEWRDWISGQFIACELYDHFQDPEENRNIADLPENILIVEQLRKQLKAGWRAAKPNFDSKQ